jgi:DNA primase
MKISQSKIDEIASSLDIVEIISQYTPLRKAGRNFMGRCPFHQEKTPSFSVSQEKGVYHCFGCGKSGNIFNFIMDIDNVSFYDAVKRLAEKANIKIEWDEEQYEDKNKIELLYEINRQAAKYFYEILMSFDGTYAKEYLNHRGIKDDVIKKFGLGFSLKQKEAFSKEFLKTFQKEDLLNAGLVIDTNMNEIRDRFRGRIMFPIFSESNRVIGFGARKVFPDDTVEGKYINSPETKIYNKSKILYGLNFSRKAIKENGFAILVEGYMDLISIFQSGIDNVIASSGTSLTSLQVKILSRYTNEIVIVYDADIAGQSAARRGIELILENNLNVSLVVLPPGEDPDSFILNNGKSSFVKLINSRNSVINYIGESYKALGKLDTPDGKAEFVKEIITLIARMKDEIKRDFYIKDIANRFSIYESIIRKELDKILKLKNRGLTRELIPTKLEEQQTYQANTNILEDECKLIRYLSESSTEAKKYILENLIIDYITNKKIMQIINYLISKIDKNELTSEQNLYNVFQDQESKQILNKAFKEELPDKLNYIFDAKKLINRLKKNNLEKRLKEINLLIQNESPGINQKLLQAHNKLEKELLVIENEFNHLKRTSN